MEGNITIAALLMSALSAALGYAFRSLWDSYSKHRDETRIEIWNIRTKEFERRLSEFYWPLYIRLQRDNVIWKKILDRFPDHNPIDEERRRIAHHVEKAIILPNHLEIVKIIENSIHLSNMDKELEQSVLQYLRHVAIYTSIRECGINDKDPISFNEPWPKNFFDLIQSRLYDCQRQYENHIKDGGILKFDQFRNPVRSDAGAKKTSLKD